ncbi:MAG: helix-turn-helix transcriptional regulator [Pseudomonadota bacterium]|uniref:helix-turn-helix domain-containing protein n=1 Tax=Sphingomonas sp. ERG5 TaxID=1381597 RepID=UPI00054C5472|nr:helix-turn-helix transcriptional regulator [Sphingomonas sp. ERG5]
MPESRFDRLTLRQKDCLRLVAQGYTSKEIGRELGISYSTVDNHLLAATQALGAGSRAEAARLFMRNAPVTMAAETDDSSGQQLPRQPQTLAVPPFVVDPLPQQHRGWQGIMSRLVPPIGGRDNDLTSSQRLLAVARIAFFAVLAFVACIMIIRMSFEALS